MEVVHDLAGLMCHCFLFELLFSHSFYGVCLLLLSLMLSLSSSSLLR